MLVLYPSFLPSLVSPSFPSRVAWTMVPSADAAKFRAVLRQSKHVVAIAGAGLSAASGMPAHVQSYISAPFIAC